jgi:BexC/CtrB/KpsE family polysaccharide export inner-membrane protein
MTDAKLNYVGPIPELLTFRKGRTAWWRRIPVAFLLVVGLPTLLAMIYYLLIASPRFVSEARFIVRSSNQAQPNALGVALQGVGLSPAQTDAFAVHEYVTSRDSLSELQRRFDVRGILAPGDPFSRFPRFWEDGSSNEALHKGLQRFVTVGYDGTTGISVMRVEAFRPRDAQALNAALLAGGESLINRLNERASTDTVNEAVVARDLARTRLSSAQQQLTAFRNRERFIDPARAATEGSQLIGGLLATVATLRAERSQLASEAPSSPQLSILDSRINAYERQIATERAKIAGDSNSLAPKIGVYEDLALQREFADRELTQATTALVTAEQEARRQKLYLERIVAPSLPDKATEPHRWTAILTVFASMMLAYGVGWLIWAGVREHRQT